jgi:hypothetical protein
LKEAALSHLAVMAQLPLALALLPLLLSSLQNQQTLALACDCLGLEEIRRVGWRWSVQHILIVLSVSFDRAKSCSEYHLPRHHQH